MTRPDIYTLVKRCNDKYGPEWDTLCSGTLEKCEEHIKTHGRYWYNGEEVILMRVSYQTVRVRQLYLCWWACLGFNIAVAAWYTSQQPARLRFRF